MPKSPVLEQKDFARDALIASASKTKVGNFVEVIEEGEGIATYLFENNQKGYVGWRWSVTIFQAQNAEPTVSEIVLMPGPDSLVAPDWVPWSERLADYKALQLELEKQAALDAEEAAEDSEDDDSDESQDSEADSNTDSDEPAEASANEAAGEEQGAEELPVANLEEGEDAENDSEDTGRKPPRFLRRRKGFKIKKARGKGKNPQD
jgi:hypothetical protein